MVPVIPVPIESQPRDPAITGSPPSAWDRSGSATNSSLSISSRHLDSAATPKYPQIRRWWSESHPAAQNMADAVRHTWFLFTDPPTFSLPAQYPSDQPPPHSRKALSTSRKTRPGFSKIEKSLRIYSVHFLAFTFSLLDLRYNAFLSAINHQRFKRIQFCVCCTTWPMRHGVLGWRYPEVSPYRSDLRVEFSCAYNHQIRALDAVAGLNINNRVSVDGWC